MYLLMRTTCLIFFLTLLQTVNSQSLTESWARSEGGSFGDGGQSIAVDHQGGIFVAASFAPGVTSVGGVPVNDGAVVIKYNRNGGVVWAKSYGNNFSIHSIAVAPDGSLFIAGTFAGSITIGSDNLTSAGATDIFLAKLDANGNAVWAKSIGGDKDEEKPSVVCDSKSSVYVGGGYKSTSITIEGSAIPGPANTYHDCFFAKFSPEGNFRYLKRVATGWFDAWAFTGISVDNNDNLHICYKPGNPTRSWYDSTGNLLGSGQISSQPREYLEGYKAKSVNEYLYTGQYINIGSPTEPNAFLGGSLTGRITSTFSYSWKYPVNPDYDNLGNEFYAGTLGYTIPTNYIVPPDSSLNFGNGKSITSYSLEDIYVIQRTITTGITYLYSSKLNNVDDHASGIAFDRGEGALYVLGSWSKRTDTSTFRFGDTVLINSGAVGTSDMLLLKFGAPSSSLTVNAGPDKTICKGGTTSIGLSNIASGGAGSYTYSWSPSTGLNPAVPDPTVVGLMKSTDYVVTVTDADNNSVKDTVRVIVDSSLYRPEIIVASGDTNPFCEGRSVQLIATSSIPWTGPATWSNGVSNFFNSITVSKPDTLTVTMTATNGCIGTSLPFITVVKPAPPIPTISPADSVSICSGNGVTFTANNTQSPVSYFWSNGNATSSITVSTPGTYTVKATGSNGCTSLPASAVVIVKPQPAGTITANGSTTICNGDSVQLSVTTQAGNSVVWSNGATSQSIWVKTSGTYTATITSPGGCSSVAQNSITVNVATLPQTPVISAGGPLSFCTGSDVTLSVQNPQAGLNYKWSTGSTANSIVVNTAGTYSLTAANSNGCISQSASVNVSVNPLPSGTIAANGSTAICSGDSIQLTVSTATGNTYTWNTGALSPSIWVKTAGTYSAQVRSVQGCTSNTNSITTTVTQRPRAFITQSGNSLMAAPSGMTYQWYLNNAPISGATAQALQINEGENYSVSVTNNGCTSFASIGAVLRLQSGAIQYQVYPNPAVGEFKLVYSLDKIAKVNIIIQDMSGQKIHIVVYDQLQTPGEYSYNLKTGTYRLQKGYYFLNIRIDNKKTIQKLVVL